MYEHTDLGSAAKPTSRTTHRRHLLSSALITATLATFPMSSFGFDGAVISLSAIDGSNGGAVTAGSEGDNAGRSVAAAGDINNDGIDDFVIGAPDASPNGDNSGAVYVVFGTPNGLPASFSLASIADGDGSAGFVLNGVSSSDEAGFSVNGAGDINADGIEDLVIGAPFASPLGRSGAGSVYVVFGKGGGFGSEFELSSLAAGNGSTGFVVNGALPGDGLGSSVAGAADVSGDEIDDLIVGAPKASLNLGYAYLLYGKDTGFTASIDAATLSVGNGSVGARLSATSSQSFGSAVSSTGDVNDDGIDDIIVGAPTADNNGQNAGEAFVLFGRNFAVNGGFGPTLD